MKIVETGRAAQPALTRVEPSAEQKDLREFWNHVVQAACFVRATLAPVPAPTPDKAAETLKRQKWLLLGKGRGVRIQRTAKAPKLRNCCPNQV